MSPRAWLIITFDVTCDKLVHNTPFSMPSWLYTPPCPIQNAIGPGKQASSRGCRRLLHDVGPRRRFLISFVLRFSPHLFQSDGLRVRLPPHTIFIFSFFFPVTRLF